MGLKIYFVKKSVKLLVEIETVNLNTSAGVWG